MSTAIVSNGSKQVPVKEKADPFMSLRHAMNRLFDDFSFNLSMPKMEELGLTVYPRIDVKETDKEVIVTAELPGVKAEDVEVQLYADSLSLSGEKRAEKEEKKANYYRVERSYGYFQRTLPLPAGIDRDAISATTQDGVLTVKLPKTKAAQEAAKKIEVKAK